MVDLGCGEGALTLELTRFARDVVGVEIDGALVEQARHLALRRGVEPVRFETADASATGLPDASFDVALLGQALHHAEEPADWLREAHRLLVPGGSLVVLDLEPHTEEWVVDRLGHRHLGFAPGRLAELLERAGFVDVEVERMGVKADDPFRVVIARGTRGPSR